MTINMLLLQQQKQILQYKGDWKMTDKSSRDLQTKYLL